MNQADRAAHKQIASAMSLKELTGIIEDITRERALLEPYLTKAELQKYGKLLFIYNVEFNLGLSMLGVDNYSALEH